MNTKIEDHTKIERSKEAKWFETKHLTSDLKTRSVKGGFNTMGVQVLSFFLTTGQTAIMSRLLTPEDYGLVAMTAVVTGLITTLGNINLSVAVIQKDQIKQSEVSSAFWINMLILLGVALIVAISAPILAYIYHEPRVMGITLVSAIGIFLGSLSIHHDALLKRQMQFRKVALIQLGSTLSTILTGILLAYLGYGYWAIVFSGVVYPIVFSLSVWIVCDWRPAFILKFSEASPFLKFGARVTGFEFFNYFARNMDNFFIGKYIGSQGLGIYSKAYQLLMLPITQLRNPLNAVALPALSALQEDEEKYFKFYKQYLFLLAFVTMPIVVYLAIFSEELVLIVLGDQWLRAGNIFKILAISAFIHPVLGTSGLILVTTGKVKKHFRIGVINAIVMVAGFAIGLRWGIEGVAMSQVIVIYLSLFPILFYTFSGTALSVFAFFKEISFPILFSLISGAAMYLLRNNFAQFPDILLCGFGFFLGAIIYILLWYISPASRLKFKQVLDIKSSFLKKK
ncbi:MAG: lipopolysaccharide biosynthesis protein [Cytophagales bacterium CG18_big_fil_WC_8_21_14_2_50_42_9]|nr:MAG: lipopolysaccharide biosynthesis protein [Cytophagales bacterium CG18_big_fil_WC_8_21_14_2_50_42_9]